MSYIYEQLNNNLFVIMLNSKLYILKQCASVLTRDQVEVKQHVLTQLREK